MYDVLLRFINETYQLSIVRYIKLKNIYHVDLSIDVFNIFVIRK